MKDQASLLRYLYRTASSKYAKFSRRINKAVETGRFQRFTTRKKASLISRLKRLRERVYRLSLQLKLAGAGAALSLVMAAVNPAAAQTTLGPFVQQERSNNPLRGPLWPFWSASLVTTDIDGDGDYDVVMGGYSGLTNGAELSIMRNEGSYFVADYSISNLTIFANDVAPAFADIDGDGDLDLFAAQRTHYNSGSSNGVIQYFRNDDGVFTEQTGPWNAATKEGNPFDAFSFGVDSNVTPFFLDFDDDDDTDVVIGLDGDLQLFLNDGDGVFTSSTIDLDVPLTDDVIMPCLADMDGDGDKDLVLGSEYMYGYGNPLRYYKQVSPGNFELQLDEWDPEMKTGNPFFDIMPGEYASPALVDTDGDLDFDLLVTSANEEFILYFENIGEGVFEQRHDTDNPFENVTVTANAVPLLIDLDEDSDLDAVIGNKYFYGPSQLHYYRNEDGQYKLVTGEGDPFDGLEMPVYSYFTPLIRDIDGDFIPELISGTYNGAIRLFRLEDGIFVQDSDNNPFQDILISDRLPFPQLADINNDGLVDLFVSQRSGDIRFFLNVGSATEPEFEEQTGTDNPADAITLLNDATFSIIDLDHDGDYDIIGFTYDAYDVESGIVGFFENFGTPENPVFGPVTGIDLSGGIFINEQMQPSFADFDNDGDHDLLLGFSYGIIELLLNENPAPILDTESPLTLTMSSAPQIISSDFGLDDPDDDRYVEAIVSIIGYEEGVDILDYDENLAEPFSEIYFDEETGKLHLITNDMATGEDIEAILATVTYQYTGGDIGNARKRGGSNKRTITKMIRFEVFDADRTNPVPLDFTITHPNDVPTLASTAPDITYTPTSGTIVIDNTVLVSDPDDEDIQSATIQIIGYQSGQDELLFNDPDGVILSNFDSSTGTLTLTGTASLADYQTALRSVQYQNTASVPSGPSRTFEFTVFDGESFSAPVTVDLHLNNAPQLNLSQTTASYEFAAIAIDNALTITDDSNIQEAVITISSGLDAAEDELLYTDVAPITSSYTAATGTLVLLGPATAAQFQAALRSVQYSNSDPDGGEASRVITIQLTDDASNNSTAQTVTVNFTAQSPPAVASGVTAVDYTSGTLVVNDNITLTDSDNADLISATVAITSGFVNTEDVLSFTAANGITGGYDATTGVLTLTGTASLSDYQTALRTVTYENTNSGDRDKNPRTIAFRVNDGTDNSNTLGTTVNLPNQAPTISANGNPPLYGSGQLVIAPELTLDDGDNATLQSATVAITSGLASGEDVLVFSNQNGITGTYTAANGTLVLSGSASETDYQAALRTVAYQNTSATPSETARVISISVNDGLNTSAVTAATIEINRPPVITPQPTVTGAGGQLSIDLNSIASDPDNNLDLNNITLIKVVTPPSSGAEATIVGGTLILNYANVPDFTGTDQLTLEICDNLNRCTVQTLSIEVGADIEVFNAVSQNGDGINDFLFLRYIKPNNRVTIYNRWGDKVFEMGNYDNNIPGKRFEGFNNNGNALPTGTYFYKVEYGNEVIAMGYLSLKQ